MSDRLPKRDAKALIEALRIRALALTGEAWERTATRNMMNEAAQMLEDLAVRQGQDRPTAPEDGAVIKAEPWSEHHLEGSHALQQRAVGLNPRHDRGDHLRVLIEVVMDHSSLPVRARRRQERPRPAGGLTRSP